MSTIDTLYLEEPTGVIYHYGAIWDGSVVRLTDYDEWISCGSDLIDFSDDSADELPCSVPVYPCITARAARAGARRRTHVRL